LQAKAYDHSGMVQFAPDGTMLFLHRTAGSKMDPFMEYPPGYAPLGYVTPPLTPRQAAHVHIAGAMVVSKFDAERPRLCAVPNGLNLTGIHSHFAVYYHRHFFPNLGTCI